MQRIAIVLAIVVTATVASAAPSSSIEGRVRGPSGEAVPRAVLIVVSDKAQRAVSRDDGTFSLSLTPGTYDVIVYSPAHDPWSFTGLHIEEGQTARIDVRLKPLDAPHEVYFDQPRPQDLADDNRVLRAMDESALCSDLATVAGTVSRYRFLWKRSFHPAVVAGLAITSDGVATGFFKEAVGTSESPGHLRVDRRIDVNDINRIPDEPASALRASFAGIREDLLTKLKDLPYRVEDGSITVDGAGWTLEVIADNKCRVIHRWSPAPRDEMRQAVELVLHLLKVRFYYDEVY